MLTKVKITLISILLIIALSSCSFFNNEKNEIKEKIKKEIINGKGEKIKAIGGEVPIEKNIETSIYNGKDETPTSKPE